MPFPLGSARRCAPGGARPSRQPRGRLSLALLSGPGSGSGWFGTDRTWQPRLLAALTARPRPGELLQARRHDFL
eukprot:7451316-Pyramimonas_sp.AAC.1